MIKINKIIVLLPLVFFCAVAGAEQTPMSCGMDMKQCMKMEQCKAMMDHSKMSGGMDMQQCMKMDNCMDHCKGMMGHSKTAGDVEIKKQKTKTNNVFE